MAWGTYLTTTINFDRLTFNNLSEVKNKIEEVEDSIEYFESRLKNLILITEPKKFCEETQDPLQWLNNESNDVLEELQQLYIEKFKLYILLQSWDYCHTPIGEPIHLPKECCNKNDDDCAYIDGDFILTNKEREEKYVS